MVVENIMPNRFGGLLEFEDRKVKFLLLAFQADLQLIVCPEIEAQRTVQVPAKLIVLCRSHDADQPGRVEESFFQLLIRKYQFSLGHTCVCIVRKMRNVFPTSMKNPFPEVLL